MSAKSRAPMGCKLVGRWRIAEADIWDRAYLDLCGPATIVIDANGRGEIAFGAMQATLNVEYGPTILPPSPSPGSASTKWTKLRAKETPSCLKTAPSRSSSNTTTATKPSSKPTGADFQQPASAAPARTRLAGGAGPPRRAHDAARNPDPGSLRRRGRAAIQCARRADFPFAQTSERKAGRGCRFCRYAALAMRSPNRRREALGVELKKEPMTGLASEILPMRSSGSEGFRLLPVAFSSLENARRGCFVLAGRGARLRAATGPLIDAFFSNRVLRRFRSHK